MATSTEPSAALSDHTTLRVGGPADQVLVAREDEELLAVLAEVSRRDGESLLVLGEGSNVVVSDRGFPGSVVVLDGGALAVRAGAREITVDAGAGVHWDDFVQATIAAGATGVELLSGIPGRVGAAPIQNVAAYGQQVCDVIEAVEVVDRDSLDARELNLAECGFGFRTSRFKTDWCDRFVVSRVRFRLPLASAVPPVPSTYVDVVKQLERGGGDPHAVADRRTAVLAARRSKSMVLDPDDPLTRSAGSFFLNPKVPLDLARSLADRFELSGLSVQYLEGRAGVDPQTRRVPAALLLRAAGFAPGDRWGKVKLSDRHVLAIVTEPGATATDVWNVSHFVRQRVRDATGVALEPEARFVGAFPPFRAETFLREHPYEPAGDHEPDWLVSYR